MYCDEKDEVVGDPKASEKVTGVPAKTTTTDDGKRVSIDTGKEVEIKPPPKPKYKAPSSDGDATDKDDGASFIKIGAGVLSILALKEL